MKEDSKRGSANFSVMDMGGEFQRSKEQGLAQKTDIRESLHKNGKIDDLDGDMDIVTKEPEGLVWKSIPGPGVSYGDAGAPYKSAENKIRAERAEANARGLSDASAKRAGEADAARRSAKIDNVAKNRWRNLAFRGDELASQEAARAARAEEGLAKAVGQTKVVEGNLAKAEGGLAKAVRRNKVGKIAAAVGVPLVAAGSYLAGRRSSQPQSVETKEISMGAGYKPPQSKFPAGSQPQLTNPGEKFMSPTMTSASSPVVWSEGSTNPSPEEKPTMLAAKGRGKADFSSGDNIVTKITKKGISHTARELGRRIPKIVGPRVVNAAEGVGVGAVSTVVADKITDDDPKDVKKKGIVSDTLDWVISSAKKVLPEDKSIASHLIAGGAGLVGGVALARRGEEEPPLKGSDKGRYKTGEKDTFKFNNSPKGGKIPAASFKKHSGKD
jgi:hypothetical protein